jgi:hypothetical protein
MKNPAFPPQNRSRPFTTEELALGITILPQSIRKRLSQTGSYFGLRPKKLPNGRLLWPENSIDVLFNEAHSASLPDTNQF